MKSDMQGCQGKVDLSRIDFLIIHFFQQERRRCGCSRDANDEGNRSIHDCFHLIISLLTSPTYLIERIFVINQLSKDELELRDSIITTPESKKLQLNNLVEVVGFIFNSSKCWHSSLEDKCGRDIIQLDNEQQSTNEQCINCCPWCTKVLTQFIKPIIKLGLIQFLVFIFIENSFNNITPMMLCHYLKVYPNVGILIYGHRVSTPPAIVFLNSIVLQLIGSKILKIEVSHNEDNQDIITVLRLNYIFECYMEFG